MADKRQIAIGAVLVVVLVVALAFVIRYTRSKDQAPAAVRNQPVEMCDEKTMDVVTIDKGELFDGNARNGCYKNPKTGAYTLRPATKCAACKQMIPVPYVAPAPVNATAEERQKHLQEEYKVFQGYMCPRCGKKAFN